MPEFAYEALTPDGVVARGAMPAADEAELEDRLRSQGSYLIRAEVARRERRRPTRGGIERRELLGLTEYLAGSVEAGIPILTSLDDVGTRLKSRRARQIVADVRRSMAEEGMSLSEALSEHPQAFSKLYISTVSAGEASGQLDYALSQLIEYLDWQEEIRSQLRQATIYPAIVLAGMAGLIGLLVGFVFPRLFPVLSTFDVALPWPTVVIMSIGLFLQRWWLVLLGALVGLVVVVLLVRQTRRGRYVLDRMTLGLPVFGPLIHQINMARLVTYLALFYRTGVELLHGLRMVEEMMENAVVSRAVGRARVAVSQGETLAAAFSATSLFPTVVTRSIALGESTGSLDVALGRAKRYYDREVPASVRRMLTTLQPLLVVLMGGVIVVIALSIFLPILTIYQSIGR
jgi:type IV pilus assembly protein PilC